MTIAPCHLQAESGKVKGIVGTPPYTSVEMAPELRIPWNEKKHGYSVYFNAGVPKTTLTRLVNRLKVGNMVRETGTYTVQATYASWQVL